MSLERAAKWARLLSYPESQFVAPCTPNALFNFPVVLCLTSMGINKVGACADVGTSRTWHSIIDGQAIIDIVNFMSGSTTCKRITTQVAGTVHFYVQCF